MDNKQPPLGKDPVAPASLQSLEQTPSTPGTVSSSMPGLPKRPSRFRSKRLILVAIILLMVVGLALVALVLNGRNKQAEKDSDSLGSYSVVENPIAASNASFATDAPDRNVTINGDLFLNGRLKLSAEANTDLTDILGRKVSLVPALNGVKQTGNISITGTVLASNFQGNGANLSNLNASAITSGTLSNDRLDPSVTRLGQTIPLTALQSTVLSTLNGIGGNADRNVDIVGSGNIVVTTDADTNQIVLSSLAGGGDITGVIAGTGLTGGGLTGDVTLNVDTGVVTVQGNTFNGIDQLVKLNGAGELPVLSATNLTNLNANNITTGELADGRLSSSVTLQGNTFNLPNKLVKLDGSGNLPALNGAAITNLNATNIGTGTVADARLSANVALLNATETFSGNVTFNQPLSVNVIQPSSTMIIGATNQSLTLQGDMSTALVANSGSNSVSLGFTGTPTGDIVYSLDASTTPGNYTLCTTVGNCANAGGGVTTLGGTTNKLTKFTGGQSIGDSAITDAGTLVTVASNGLFKAGADSTTAFRVQKAATSANVFTVDTSNSRVAIGQNTASYPLDVAGDINSTTGLRVGGNLVCDSSGCAASNGSGFYIQNGTTVQTAANLNIESASTTSPTIALKAKSGQTSNLLEASNSAGSPVATIDASGNVNTVGQFKVNGAQIASSNLSNDANLAKLNGTQTFTGTDTFKNASDSTAGFQVQNASGAGVIVADTSNKRVAIGQDTAGYTLDVNGDVNITGGSSYRINGVAICGPLATCAPSSGSAAYVQNGLVKQTANYNIQSSNATAIGSIVQGAVGQTADVFQARNSNDDVIAKITASGAIYQGANQVCDASNNCNYATASGNGNYIQNGTSSQTANMNIKSASVSSVTSNIQGASGQTANILQVTDGTTQGNTLLSVNQTTPNLLINSSFEAGLSGWTLSGSATQTRTTSEQYIGGASLQLDSTAANSTALYNYSLAASTTYTLSMYMKASISTNMRIGWSPDGSTESFCTANSTIGTTWSRVTCTFTTGAVSGTPYIYSKVIGTGTRTVYVDAVQLELGSVATAFQQGTISLNGVVTSPTTFRNQSDSSSALQIQNAAGTPQLTFDTTGTGALNIYNSVNRALTISNNKISNNANVLQLEATGGNTVEVVNSGGSASFPAFRVSGSAGAAVQAQIKGATTAQTEDIFQVQGGNTTNNVLTVGQNNTNLVPNPSFDVNTTGWSGIGSANGARVTTDQYSGTGSMLITTTATANDGMRTGSITVAASTTYTLSFYARTASSFSTMEYGTIASATFTPCQTAQTVGTTWTRYTCTFTSAASTSAQVFVRQTDAAIHTFYVDAFQLELGSTATNYSLGNIGLNGTVTSPTTFQNQSNSTNTFQIQNAAGEQALSIDTTTNNLLANSGFDLNTTGWSALNSGTFSRITSPTLLGDGAITATGGAATDGVKYAYPLASSTTYTLSYYGRYTSSWTNANVGRSDDGSTNTDCLGMNWSVVANVWTRVSCTFTTGTVTGTPYIYVRHAGTMFMDGFQLETGSAATQYRLAQINLNGVVGTPLALKNTTDSQRALSIQNAAGADQMSFNTNTGMLCVGTCTSNQLVANQGALSLLGAGSLSLGNGSTGTLSVGSGGYGNVFAVNSGTANVVSVNQLLTDTNKIGLAVQGYAGGQAGDIFQAQAGNTTSSILSVGQNSANLIGNASFDTTTNPWAITAGGAGLTRITTDQYSGTGSMRDTNTATANTGGKYNYQLAASTTYTFSIYAKAEGSNFSTFEIGYNTDGTTYTSCLTAQTVTTTNWTRYTCTFTMPASVSSTRFVYFRQTDATARSFLVDAVQLEAAGAATNYNPGNISLNGVVTSPTTFQNQSNSTSAFQVQNTASEKVLAIDTTVTNLVTNSSFETDTSGWTARGGATIARSTAQKYVGDSSLAITYTTASGDGASFAYALAPSTTYSLSMQVYMPVNGQYSSPMYSSDGTTTTPCSNNVPLLNSWQRITCAFTTSSVSGTTYIGFSKSFGTAGTMYVDAIQLELGSAATSYRSAGISINGIVTSPLAIQAAANSNTALTVRSTDGTQVFGVDTSTSGVYANNITAAYGLNLRAGSGGYVALQSQDGSSSYLTASGSGVSIKPNGNSNFTVQSSTTSTTALGVDLTPSATNLITNPSFDTNTTGWANFTGATLTRITSDQYSGQGSLSSANTGTAGAGAKFAYNLAASTTYSFSLYAKATGANFSTFQIGYSADGATNTSCLTAQTVTTTGWTRYTCTFTTTTVSGTRYVYFSQTDGTARTFYVDAVQLESAAAPTNYNLGNISLNGTITSPTTFQNQSNSSTAFQVQNAAGTNILAVDTVNSVVKATSILGGASNQLNIGSTSTQQQFNPGTISQFGTVNFMDSTQNNQVLTVNSTTTGVNLAGLGSNFSTGTGGMTADGGATFTRSVVDQYSGAGSLRVVTTGAANDGVKLGAAWVGGLLNSTTYTLSVYAKATTSNFNTFQIGHSNDGTTYTSCLTAQTVITTAWQRYSCTFTTAASGSGRFIYFRQTDANNRTFYLDAIQLESGSVATGYSEGTITANGVFNSPAVFKNSSDSTTAFQIQNAAGANMFSLATANNPTLDINGGQSGELGSWATNSTTLPAGRVNHASVTANGYVYVIGGSNSSTVYYAKLNADGSTGAWTTNANALPAVRSYESSVVANGYVYVIGGYDGSVGVQTVYYAKLNADGSTSAWTTSSNALPGIRWGQSSVVANGYVYVMGGYNGSAFQSTVYYAKLNANGSTGAWTTSANALPAIRAQHNSFVNNGYVYVVGGTNDGNPTAQSTVYYAKLNTDGSTGTWTTNTNALPAGRVYASAAVNNGYAYIMGGYNGLSTVYYAKLNTDGSSGAWQTSGNSLTGNNVYQSSVSANGYIYTIGGSLNTVGVWYASTSRIRAMASLDLVGNSCSALNDSPGDCGGSIASGNIFSTGKLEVNGMTNLNGGAAILGPVSIQSSGTDSTSAFQVQNAAGSSLFTVDSTNRRVGVNTPAPATTFEVAGSSAGSGKLRVTYDTAYTDRYIQMAHEGDSSGSYIRTSGSAGSSSSLNIAPGNNVALSLQDTGAALFKNSTNTTNAVQVQNSAGSQIFNIDSTSTANLITNSNFDTGTTGWSVGGGATLSRTTTDQYSGAGSMQVNTTAAINDGARYLYNLAASTTYTFSFYGRGGSGGFTVGMGYSADGTTLTACTPVGMSTSAWAKRSCTFTTPSTVSGSRFVYVQQTDAASRFFLIDLAQLEVGASATSSNVANITLNGAINAPLLLQGTNNSTAALQVQNTTGTSIFTADTISNRVTIGSGTGSTNQGLTVSDAARIQNVMIGATDGASTLRGASGSGGLINLQNSASQPFSFTSFANTTASNVFQFNATPNSTAENLLQVQRGGTAVATVGNGGAWLLKNSTNSAAAFQIQDASSTPILTVDSTNLRVTVIDLAVTGHIISGGSTPGIAAGVAAGTSPSISITGTDTAGTITVTTGTSPALGGIVATINFATAFASAPVVVFSPTNPGASSLSGASAIYVTPAAGNFTLNTWSGGLTASTLYQWSYHVIQ